jgi:hypothetical protein
MAVSSPFHGLPVSETIVHSADLTDLKASSVLTGRRRVRLQPQTGVVAGPGSIVQFVLSDSTGLLDTNSITFSCTIQTTVNGELSGDNNFQVLDEGMSMFRRGQLLLNGSLLEDIDNMHRAANMEIIQTCDASFYKGDASISNFWKFNETLSLQLPTSQNDVPAHAAEITADLSGGNVTIAGGTYNRGIQVAVPMSVLMPSLRGNKYWPLRNMGELVTQLTLAAATEAIWTSAPTGVPSYILTDIFMEYDLVTVHPMYASLLDRMTQLSSEPGLNIAVTSRLVSQGVTCPVSIDNSTEYNIIVSRASTNLRRVIFGAQPTQGLNSYSFPSVSCFGDHGTSAWQCRVGSLYFPAQPANSLGRLWYQTSAAWGQPAATDKSAVINRHNYDTTTVYNVAPLSAAVFYQVPAAGGQFIPPLVDASERRFPFSDFSIKAYNFDAYKGGEKLDNDGVSILGQAGSQLQIIWRASPREDVTPTIVLDATRVIQLKDGGLRILGA